MQKQPSNFQSLYEEYQDSRLVLKYETYATWTIPSAFPDNYLQGNKGNMDVKHDYQSMGALLVNFLSAKLTGLLFPVNQSFFKINFSDELKAMQEQAGMDIAAAKSELVKLENKACQRLFLNASYAQLVQLMRYLIITGNALIKREDGKLTIYSPRNFVQLRDNSGNVLDMVLRESVAYGTLPQEIRTVIGRGKQDTDDVTIYTRIKRILVQNRVNYVVTQQIDGIGIGEASTYPEKLCPFIPVVWNLVNGDSYGRGMVEDYAGDFAKLSDLSRALTLYELDSCKVIKAVKPGSTVDIDSINDAEVGEYVFADPTAIAAVESGEYQKIQQLGAEIQTIFQRLSLAFMYQGNTRDAERVTAEEIKMNAMEADKALGGVYSQLAESTHIPLAYILCSEVDPDFILAVIGSEVQLEVLTGVTALGRAADVTKLLQAVQELAAIIPVLKQVSPRFDTERIVDQVLQAKGLTLDDLMLTEQQLQEQQQQMDAQAQMQDPLAGVQAAGELM